MKTKIFAILLALVLVCSFVACGDAKTGDEDKGTETEALIDTEALTGAEPQYETEGTPVEGGTISIEGKIENDMLYATVSVTGNPGLAAFNLSLNYDNTKICPVEVIPGELVPGDITSNIQQSEEITATLTNATAFYYGPENFEGDGELFTMTFKVLDASDAIEITLGAGEGAFVNETLQNVTFDLGSFTTSAE